MTTADNRDDLAQVVLVVDHKPVGHIQVFPKFSPHHFRSIIGFDGSDLAGAAAAEFSTRKVKQSEGVSELSVAQEGSAGAQLYVVRVNADGENIYCHNVEA